MVEKRLYEVTVWDKKHFTLLTPHEADQLRDYLAGESTNIFSVRFIDDQLCSVACVTELKDARQYDLPTLVEKLRPYFPKKIEALEFKDGKLYNKNQGMLSLAVIPDHKRLYAFLFGSKLHVSTKDVHLTATVNATIEAEIEIPEKYNPLEYSEYIKNNKEFLKITDLHYTLDDIYFDSDIIPID